jgi:hypothetical protein
MVLVYHISPKIGRHKGRYVSLSGFGNQCDEGVSRHVVRSGRRVGSFLLQAAVAQTLLAGSGYPAERGPIAGLI